MPETTPWWLLAISIISTAAVSIFGIVVPFWLEKGRADREDARQEAARQRSELAEIDQAAQALLMQLSIFRGPSLSEINVSLSNAQVASNVYEAASVLQSKFYGWESKVWDKLSATDRQKLKELRTSIESKQISEPPPRVELRDSPRSRGRSAEDNNPFTEEVPEIAEQVLLLTRHATGRE